MERNEGIVRRAGRELGRLSVERKALLRECLSVRIPALVEIYFGVAVNSPQRILEQKEKRDQHQRDHTKLQP
jgi:hypothetical protein